MMKAIYETWDANGFKYISSLSTIDTLRVWLSVGFEDRMRAVCLSHEVDSLSFEEILRSTHEEGDTRMARHIAFCFRNGFQRENLCANDIDTVLILVD